MTTAELMSLADVKNRLSDVVDRVERGRCGPAAGPGSAGGARPPSLTPPGVPTAAGGVTTELHNTRACRWPLTITAEHRRGRHVVSALHVHIVFVTKLPARCPRRGHVPLVPGRDAEGARPRPGSPGPGAPARKRSRGIAGQRSLRSQGRPHPQLGERHVIYVARQILFPLRRTYEPAMNLRPLSGPVDAAFRWLGHMLSMSARNVGWVGGSGT